MSLWGILQSGGVVMIALGLLSIVLLALVLFLYLKLNAPKLVPAEFSENIINLLNKHQYDQAADLADGSDSLISAIVLEGLDKKGQGPNTCRESVELAARKEVSSLWTSLNYISDIAQIAPMLGLLGTVLGMIQAFNTIAFEAAVVKPILLAGGVSKAMITTAGGLVIAIIATIFYALLRSKAQYITDLIQNTTSRILEALSK
ncbi:MAG: MotA/TolQ/ExbB proton channel family protein [Candidatus Omnitrophica bacterium]|nr:MotA/TolQ/ExbB proton channel family protein [Candidatus Omnitrophota bacterium]